MAIFHILKRKIKYAYPFMLLTYIAFYYNLPAQAQTKDKSSYLVKANNYYEGKNYYQAVINYELYLGLRTDDIKLSSSPFHIKKQHKTNIDLVDYATYYLADSYRMLHDFAKSELFYKKVKDDKTYPYRLYWLGISLRANEKFEESKRELDSFVKSYNKKDQYLKNVLREIENLEFISSQLKNKTAHNTAPERLITNQFNLDEGAYNLLIHNNDTIFTAARKDSTAKQRNQYTNNIFYAIGSKALTDINNDNQIFENGEACMSPDGNYLYFTKNDNKSLKEKYTIYRSKKTGNSWGEPEKLGKNINLAGYNNRQPNISTDGKYLIFSSDRKGGKGKYDIWYAQIDNNNIGSQSFNAGDLINTEENEYCPFYHSASQTLVFSSDGRVGMGGFDIYSSKGTFGLWSKPENLGIPFNSVKDDLYFFSNEKGNILENAWFSSDRASDCCLYIFSSKQPVSKPEIIVAKPTIQLPVIETIILYFDYDQFILTRESVKRLDEFISSVKNHQNMKLEIKGYTDTNGSEAYNLSLSEKRVNSCINYLEKNGIAKENFIYKALGECCPIENEKFPGGKDNAEGRSKNRRVTISLVKYQEANFFR